MKIGIEKEVVVVHNKHCNGNDPQNCEACRLREEWQAKYGKRLFVGEARHLHMVVLDKLPEPPWHVGAEFLSASGWAEEGKDGVLTESYGQQKFWPEGKILARLPASIHGTWKIRANQEVVVILYKDPKVFVQENPGFKIYRDNKGGLFFPESFLAVQLEGEFEAKGSSGSGWMAFFGRAHELGIEDSRKAVLGHKERFVDPLAIDEETYWLLLEPLTDPYDWGPQP